MSKKIKCVNCGEKFKEVKYFPCTSCPDCVLKVFSDAYRSYLYG